MISVRWFTLIYLPRLLMIYTWINILPNLSISAHTHTHTHTHTHIYIYVYFGGISSLIHVWLNIIDIFCLHIFFVNPFELANRSYDIRQDLVDKPSIISYFPSTFCQTLGHLQGKMYYKSHVTFVCTLLLRKNECSYWCIM